MHEAVQGAAEQQQCGKHRRAYGKVAHVLPEGLQVLHIPPSFDPKGVRPKGRLNTPWVLNVLERINGHTSGDRELSPCSQNRRSPEAT